MQIQEQIFSCRRASPYNQHTEVKQSLGKVIWVKNRKVPLEKWQKLLQVPLEKWQKLLQVPPEKCNFAAQIINIQSNEKDRRKSAHCLEE